MFAQMTLKTPEPLNFGSTAFEPRALDLVLPWQRDAAQEEKFEKLLKKILLGLLLFMLIIPWLPVFEPELQETEQVVKTKVLLEPVVIPPKVEVEPPKPVAPPPPPVVKPKPVKEAEPKPQIASAPPPKPVEPAPKDKEAILKEQGLAQMSTQLSALRNNLQVDKLQRKNVTKSDLGKVEHAARDVFGEDIAGKRSQGIQVDERVLRQESHGLAAYSGVAVEADQYSDLPGGSSLSYLSGQAGRRDMENIRRTFEAAKSSVYSLYLQSLHEHPELAGKFIFRLIIEPDGSISDLELVSSELGLRDLESTILGRIRNINFGAQDVSPTAVEYAFSFLPS